MICDWAGLDVETEQLQIGVASGRMVARPFAFLPTESSQALQTQCANLFADREFPTMASFSAGQRYRHDRIRVAYLSADFRDHPVSHLLVGMFEHHDRTRIETTAFSFGASKSTPLRRQLETAFDQFVDCRNLSDAEIARMLQEREIDIAIDLMGPTENARPGIFSYRPAPVQAIFLGFAGSSGAPYMDYIIADRIVIPEEEQNLIRERWSICPTRSWAPIRSELLALPYRRALMRDCRSPVLYFAHSAIRTRSLRRSLMYGWSSCAVSITVFSGLATPIVQRKTICDARQSGAAWSPSGSFLLGAWRSIGITSPASACQFIS